jgi:glycogen debranching enzyme
VKEDNDFLIVDLTNPVLPLDGDRALPHGVIHLVRTTFLWSGDFFERIEVSNFAPNPVSLTLELAFQADFVDLFEVRGTTRERRGRALPASVDHGDVVLAYEGLDSIVRRTEIHFSRSPREIDGDHAKFTIELKPKEQKSLESRIRFLTKPDSRNGATFDAAFGEVHRAYEDYRKSIPIVETSNPQFNDWINQSRADLHLLLTTTSQGLYPYAGIPWFSCIFGRDGVVTALETLWLYPEIARGVLTYLAKRQAKAFDADKDAEPGKILHEERLGEMVTLGEVPFGCYYGSIDSTPLWLMLAGGYYERTGDRELISQLWPNIESALEWIDRHGDCDGDGFVEYRRKANGGLCNQGWKDSDDSVFHADGTLPEAPIALCEVQGYVYEAKLRSAELADALGKHERAEQLRAAARKLKEHFQQAFWCEEIQTYAIALDGNKRPCRIRSSNAAQCLFTGIASDDSAARIKDGLFDERFFSGWGVRTLASSEQRYNPMSYHDGSIWPHDNALIASGLARYGFKDAALRVLTALFDASQFMDSNRMPELFCGFRRRRGEGPTLYPVACNPQAWSSAAVFCALQACMGLRIDAATERVHFDNPKLPQAIEHLEIRDLPVAGGRVDVSLVRNEHDVAVNLRRRTGKVEVVVIH